jgi:hypothetical protein
MFRSAFIRSVHATRSSAPSLAPWLLPLLHRLGDVRDDWSLADAAFEYDGSSDTFSPATEAATAPQGHGAKCGFVRHTLVKDRDYVFTEYGKR